MQGLSRICEIYDEFTKIIRCQITQGKVRNSNYFWGAQGFEFYARLVQWEPTRTTTAEFSK